MWTAWRRLPELNSLFGHYSNGTTTGDEPLILVDALKDFLVAEQGAWRK
eukprot:gene2328-1115_t